MLNEKATSCFSVFSNDFFWQEIRVVRVTDGDTFVIEGGERVRMIGINAPELNDIYGVESKNHLKTLIESKYVNLIKGVILLIKTTLKGF
jgi:micrococcal nuclease